MSALFLGLAIGVILALGIDFAEKNTSELITDWLSIPDNLFLKIIQMIIISLIFVSII
ncbi:MAG: cation:dicarboxylase symporter family transporter [Nitrosopumilus sp.]|nr:cation:dicarboxylase symporter family transporter [Nitrosopumilus sp.]MDH3486513.1 cation:dicarboxylase symporter family transporter [Nitrosopumilus sp.]